jgi:hypothetical protein
MGAKGGVLYNINYKNVTLKLLTVWFLLLGLSMHCKSGPHKNGIRKSSRKTYDHIMGI